MIVSGLNALIYDDAFLLVSLVFIVGMFLFILLSLYFHRIEKSKGVWQNVIRQSGFNHCKKRSLLNDRIFRILYSAYRHNSTATSGIIIIKGYPIVTQLSDKLIIEFVTVEGKFKFSH